MTEDAAVRKMPKSWSGSRVRISHQQAYPIAIAGSL
jgi:hypothetical protein